MSTLSVLLTNYNDSSTLGRCLEAIVSQSRTPDEFIIQDDASTDNSVAIIQSFADKYPFIRFVQNQTNMGVIAAIGKLLSLPRGDYMFSTSADDYIADGVLGKCMELLERYPQAGLCTGDIQLIDSCGNSKGTIRLGLADSPCYLSPEEVAERLLGNPLFGHCTIYRQDAFSEAGGFIPELKWHSDWFCNLVIAFRHGICYIPEVITTATDGRIGSYCHEGMKDWSQESDSLVHAVQLLKTTHRDVLPFFIRSAAFAVYHPQAARAIMTRPELWDAESMLLMQLPLHLWSNAVLQKRQQRLSRFQNHTTETPDLTAFIQTIITAVEQNRHGDALDYYNKFRNRFPRSPDLEKFDTLVNNIRTKMAETG